jgi:hypothetical protein
LHSRARRPDICNKEPNPWAIFMWVKPISFDGKIQKPKYFQFTTKAVKKETYIEQRT